MLYIVEYEGCRKITYPCKYIYFLWLRINNSKKISKIKGTYLYVLYVYNSINRFFEILLKYL